MEDQVSIRIEAYELLGFLFSVWQHLDRSRFFCHSTDVYARKIFNIILTFPAKISVSHDMGENLSGNLAQDFHVARIRRK